jgi:uncharacterized protein with HEPN domain
MPDAPWSNIVGMRHILVHNYFGIDAELVWNVVENQLEPLKNRDRSLSEAAARLSAGFRLSY